jgi:low affinity Fe/Cu permease
VSRRLLTALALLFHHSDVNTVAAELGNVCLATRSVKDGQILKKKTQQIVLNMSETTNPFININHQKGILRASFTWMRHHNNKLYRYTSSPKVFPLTLLGW